MKSELVLAKTPRPLTPYPTVPVPPPGAETVVLTRELLLAGRGPGGGWSVEQLAVLGVPHPRGPQWTIRMYGVPVAVSLYRKFLDLRPTAEPRGEAEF